MFRKYTWSRPGVNRNFAATPVWRLQARAAHDGTVPRSAPSPGRTGRPPAASRAEILAGAPPPPVPAPPEILTAPRQLIDRDGWEKLTIRRLAAETGIGATTLYH